MAKKKFNSLSDLGNFMLSTNKEDNFSELNDTPEGKLKNEDQFLEAHFSNKGRGGKTVTIIKGFEGSENDLKKLGKLLKQKCGVGGSVKNNQIIIQGNYRNKIIEILKKEKYNVKRVGG